MRPLILLTFGWALTGCGEKLDPVRVREAPAPIPESSKDPCWERDIVPIFRDRCYACHDAGTLHDYSSWELVQPNIDQIKFKVQVNQMPLDAPLDTARKRILFQWIADEGPRCGP